MNDELRGSAATAGNHERVRPSLIRDWLAPSWQHRKRMLRREAWILAICSYVALAFAWMWPQAFRNTSQAYVAVSLIAFIVRVFLFHLGLLLGIVGAISLWTRQWRLLATAVPLIAFTLGPTVWSYRPRSEPQISGDVVKVMSVNLLMLNRNTKPLLEEILAADADVLLLQEYTAHWHAAMRGSPGEVYPYECHVCREDSFGAAIFSKRPFVGSPAMDVPLGVSSLPQIRAVVEIGGRPVALYNIHLLPPTSLEYTTETRMQFADLLDHLAKEPLPLIMAGDFNFTETTPQASELRTRGLHDAFDIGGRGGGATWPVNSFLRYFPGIRLDHLYLRGGLASSDCRTGQGVGSDHRPVIARIGFAQHQAAIDRR